MPIDPTSRPVTVRARIVRGGNESVSLERASELTPYAMQVIAEDAAHAGRGAKLEVVVPESVDAVDLAAVRGGLARLSRGGVDVTIRREAWTPLA